MSKLREHVGHVGKKSRLEICLFLLALEKIANKRSKKVFPLGAKASKSLKDIFFFSLGLSIFSTHSQTFDISVRRVTANRVISQTRRTNSTASGKQMIKMMKTTRREITGTLSRVKLNNISSLLYLRVRVLSRRT